MYHPRCALGIPSAFGHLPGSYSVSAFTTLEEYLAFVHQLLAMSLTIDLAKDLKPSAIGLKLGSAGLRRAPDLASSSALSLPYISLHPGGEVERATIANL